MEAKGEGSTRSVCQHLGVFNGERGALGMRSRTPLQRGEQRAQRGPQTHARRMAAAAAPGTLLGTQTPQEPSGSETCV